MAAPDNHLGAGPDCGVAVAHARCISEGRDGPTICARIVFAARVQVGAGVGPGLKSAPDNHLSSGPDRGVSKAALGRVDRAGGCPTVRARIISPAAIQITAGTVSAPRDHFTAGPDCCLITTAIRRAGHAGGGPRVIGASVPSTRYFRKGIVSRCGGEDLGAR